MRRLSRVRRTRRTAELPAVRPKGAEYRRILVPMRLDDVGGVSVATAVALAKETGAEVEAVAVVRVPRRFPLEGPLPPDVAQRVDTSLENVRTLGERHGVAVAAHVVRARSLGHAIVDEARSRGADLVVLGSSPRWRKRSHLFSPTADFVRRHAGCEVVVVPPREDVAEE
jgi:nucleotide-binding universal stress UspA family protein